MLVLAPLTASGQADVPFYTDDFPPEEFAERRERVFDAIGPQAAAVVQGAPRPEGYVRFRQDNEFYYLTGIEVPHAYLILDASTRQTTLFWPIAIRAESAAKEGCSVRRTRRCSKRRPASTRSLRLSSWRRSSAA